MPLFLAVQAPERFKGFVLSAKSVTFALYCPNPGVPGFGRDDFRGSQRLVICRERSIMQMRGCANETVFERRKVAPLNRERTL